MAISNTADQGIIERIIYLASLASDVHAIDTKLDTLRIITARLDSEVPGGFTDADRQRLTQLEQELKQYLTTSDPVRSFTPESLQKRLDQHVGQSNGAIRGVKRQVATIFMLCFGVYGLGVLFAPGGLTTKFALAAPLFLVQLHAGLAWLYWSARHELVAALRVAYGYIGAGLLMSALGSVQFPILFAYPSLNDLAVFRYAGFMPLFPIMCLLFYVGLYIFARQLPDIKLRFLRPMWIAGTAVLSGAVVVLMPHAVSVPEELFFDLSLLSTFLSVFFSIPAAVLGFAVARRLTARYSKAMQLFASAQIAVAAACAMFFVVLYMNGPISGVEVALYALPFALSESLMLISAYLFKKNISE